MPDVYFITAVCSVNNLLIYTIITRVYLKYEREIVEKISWWRREVEKRIGRVSGRYEPFCREGIAGEATAYQLYFFP